MIQISQTAAKEIKRLKKSRQQPDNLFRLSVQTGGCSGLLYILEFDRLHSRISENESKKSTDITYESNGLTIVVDEQTHERIKGLELDFSEDLMGGGFRFKNPNAVSTCQCGLSFTTTQ